MKRTLIFKHIEPDESEEELKIIMEGTQSGLNLFQSLIERKLGLHGWFLSKVIIHLKEENKK